MIDSADQKVGLQVIVVILEKLVQEAEDIDQSPLAIMLDQAKVEAENQLRRFRN